MTGAADIVVTTIVAAVGIYVMVKVTTWLAERFIEAIDWITRNE